MYIINRLISAVPLPSFTNLTRVIVALLAVGCNAPPQSEDAKGPTDIAFEIDNGRFVGDPPPSGVTLEVFTMAAADMDLDGDADVMLNRHLLAPIEVYENVGDRFVQVNPRADDTSGLWDNWGVPDLYAVEANMLADIAASDAPGLYIWHDEYRAGGWRLMNTGPELELLVEVDRAFLEFLYLAPPLIDRQDAYTARVRLPEGELLGVINELIGTQLKVTVTSQDIPVMYLGRTMAPREVGFVSLWKGDPHGVAWVDAVGSAEPDLFVTRGGLVGNLLPPFDGKVDQLYEYKDGETLYEQVAPSVIGPDYCRGRQTAWFDLDSDGVNELYVSCTLTPNKLLDDTGDGVFADRAPELGLDHVEPDAFAIFDVNGDGFLDVVHNDLSELMVHLREGDGFVENPGADWGLVSPVVPEDLPEGIWNPFALHTFDFDRDGDLDLWASNFRAQEVAVFRRDGDRFVDATADLGLGDATGFMVLMPTDVDNDGWLDLAAASNAGMVIWRNEEGRRFTPLEVGGDGYQGCFMAVAADVDNDGRIDFITSKGEETSIFFNRTAKGGKSLLVDVSAPLGTLVRGHYADGTVLVQQWGSADVSRYSQGLLPLRFGVSNTPLESIDAQWPGETEPRTIVNIEPDQTRIAI